VRELFSAFVEASRIASHLTIPFVAIQHAFRESKSALARRMWGFFGPVGFVKTATRYAMVKATDRTVQRLLADWGFPCQPIPNVNAPAFVDRVSSLYPDVLLSVAAPQIFKTPLLSTSSWGCITAHSGPLPRYRGMPPTFWQLFHAEPRIGITVHTMVPKIDGGDILRQEYTAVQPRESLDSGIRRTKCMAARMVVDTLLQIADGSVSRAPMNLDEGSYFSFPTAAEARQLRARGGRLI